MSASPTRTTEFLDQLEQSVRQAQEVTNARFRPLDVQELNRRPGPGKWSVGQCLEHLNIMGGHYLPDMMRRVRLARQQGSRPAEQVKHGYFGRKLVEAMRVPASEKPLKAPQQYAPSGSRLPRTVVEVFGRQLDELLRIIAVAREVNANRVRIPNPVIPLLRLRLTDQLEALVLHLERHLLQAGQVLDSKPAAGAGRPATFETEQ
ncbi:DinB family protein [Hymenobacter lutimineralis]|uniref:DinB family protein n=1 Tax=Hymenobacter lutimineralis TaxID=2606448 RepID=A0A5D6V190_9BACT|nr:DinB family protein [Hymenobacter lutimineralis]TYZ09553.1 DinB family protein [Hymenobacter lutimineralis]